MKKPNVTKFERFAEMTLAKYERYLPTAFDESLTLLEKMNKLIQYLNEMGLLVNDVVEDWNTVMEWVMNDGLTESVYDKLDQMMEDGTLAKILAQLLLDDYATKEDLNTKVNKGDLFVNVKDFNVTGNGVTNDTNSIQTVLNNHDDIFFPDGVYLLKNTLTIPIEKKLRVSKNTVFKLEHNSIGFDIRQRVEINGTLHVKVPNTYTNSAVYFDGSKSTGSAASSFEGTLIDGIHVEGDVYGMGNGVHFDCSKTPSSISFVKINNLFVKGFEKNIFIDCPPIPSGTNYVTGLMIDNIVLKNSDYYLYSTGDHSTGGNQASGNLFSNMQLQWTSRCKEFIHIEGRNNEITGMGWDIGNKNVTYVYLGDKSSRNIINTNLSSDLSNILDKGSYNYVRPRDEIQNKPTIKNRPLKRRLNDAAFNGDYEDILHNAHLLHTINILNGATNITSNDISQVFQGDTDKNLRLVLDSYKNFEFEIVFNTGVYPGHSSSFLPGRLRNIGFSFEYNRTPEIISLEITSSKDEVVTTEYDMTNYRYDPFLIISGNSVNGLLFNSIKKIKIRLIGQYESDVRLSRVFANSEIVGGNRYLSNSGGIITGDLEVRGNLLLPDEGPYIDHRLPILKTQPSHEEYHYGRIAIINTPNGDKVRTCIKLSDGSYQWVDIGG